MAAYTRLQRLLGFVRNCGPGVVSGAANDDPSCIVTYSIAGAQFGFLTLWTSLYSLPLIAAIQLLCSRLGMVGGRGLAGAVRRNYPPWVLYPLCALLAGANIVTLGADLGGMAGVSEMVSGIPASIWTAVYAVGIGLLLILLSYSRIERTLKWLCLVLFTYIAAGIMVKPDWRQVLIASLLPRFDWSTEYFSTLVALLGATVSPYFLFWQASQEVEAEYSIGRRTARERRGATPSELARSNVDVAAGSFISKAITYFITLSTAQAFLVAGQNRIATARDAARALAPVAGNGAEWLFALGVVGTGLLAVPVLAGSCAYAWSEAFRWRASLEEKPRHAPNFYAVLSLAVLLGLGSIYLGFHPVRMLFWASILNGLLAPACILLITLLAGNENVMGPQKAPGWLRFGGWAAFSVTATAAVAMLVFSLA